jgi:hypothetical protein
MKHSLYQPTAGFIPDNKSFSNEEYRRSGLGIDFEINKERSK